MSDAGQERIAEPEIATTTLAEIYFQQGLYDRALAIYRRIAERTPGDPRVTARVAELERTIERLGSGEERPAALAHATALDVVTREAAPPPAAREPAAAPPPATPVAPVERDAAFLAWLERK